MSLRFYTAGTPPLRRLFDLFDRDDDAGALTELKPISDRKEIRGSFLDVAMRHPEADEMIEIVASLFGQRGSAVACHHSWTCE